MSRPPRLPPPPDSADLNVIGARVRELNAKSALAGVAAARLVWQARALFKDGAAWLGWCQETAQLSRRHAFRCTRAAIYHIQLEEAGLLDAIPSEILSVAMLEAIAAIPVADLLRFLESIDLTNLSADDVSDLAMTFIGKPRAHRDFVAYRGPTPERLVAGLDTPEARKTLDPINELDLVVAHVTRLKAVREKLTQQDRDNAIRYFNQIAMDLLQEAKA